ncbi:ATP-binding protein [Pseudoduganella sp. OTU4001]|uniref:ATP-binding protein n=1 Tax=Pseudoduganella sp. OTU4001 TaxID=3043854 RepID=UPI00313B2C72
MSIARKIALAMIGIVILCIGTMAWLSTINLQRGFIAYLNQVQAQDMEQVSKLLAEHYRREGSFDSLRHQRGRFRDLLDQMNPQIQPASGNPPPPEREHERPRRGEGPPRRAPPPPAQRDPMSFAARLTVQDAQGISVIGPPSPPPGIERDIVVDGVTVGKISLLPLRHAARDNASAASFLRDQLLDMLWLAGILVAVAVGAAFWLARHLLRPLPALRQVSARLARGDFSARVEVRGRDELAELAGHLNAMAQELEQSDRKRRQMLSDISHELRTPLTVIRGEIEALQDGIRKAGPEALQSLHAEVLRLNQLVEELHQLMLADAGELPCHMERIRLGAALKPTLERFRIRAADAGLALEWQLAANDPAVHADPARLAQVLVNLLENSVRYTDKGGVIRVAVAATGGQAVLTVDDSAPGVPDGAHGQLFERLYRVDSARTRASGGSGLGLAICKALVATHGGSIEARPSQLGGLQVRINLPLEPK